MAASTREIEGVYNSRYGSFRRAVAAIVGDDASHDVVQDGFARALERRRQFRGGSLESWVWKAVLRKAFDERRRRTTVLLEDAFDDALVASESDPDLSYAEIADVLEVAEGTVAATLAQAHAELRAGLELEGVER